jgi:hypothetical protein
MERSKYLEFCRKNAICPNSVKVMANGIKFAPKAYLLGFDKQGATIHTAILKDLKADSEIWCPLDDVEEM